jgi:hypothetical protein
LFLIMLSLGVGADALFRSGSSQWEWFVVAMTVVAASPGPGSTTLGHCSVIEASFQLRRRLRWVSLEDVGDSLEWGSGRRVWCYEFIQRGRLDLTGSDVTLASRLARMAESFAASGQHTHVSIHVEANGMGAPVHTVLGVSAPSVPPREWRPHHVAGVPGFLKLGRTPYVQRRTYVRTPDYVMRTLRAATFSPGRESEVLEALSERVAWLTLSLHASVIPTVRARRVTSRAVHRVGSDAALTRGAGFRWSARHEKELEALRSREASVAAGAALCQWALYVVVRAHSLGELRSRVTQTRQVARAAGLRLDAGTGVQGEWLTYQLPGGPGW